MNNLYHRVAVVSVGIALGFTLGANKEAKAATFSLTETSSYHLADRNQDGLPDRGDTGASLAVGIRDFRDTKEEDRVFYEFNIANLSLDSNTVVSNAFLQVNINNIRWYRPHSRVEAYGYTENEKVAPSGVYNAGEYLDEVAINNLSTENGILAKRIAIFNVLPFINQRIGSNNSFAGFGIRFLNGEGFVTLDRRAHLNITTAKVPEPVPEPTTIFGSALGLCLGGWLKRKKSSQQNKTTPQA